MLDFFQKVRYQILLLVLGVALVTLAFFQVEDIKAFKVSPLQHPLYLLFAVGLLLVIASLLGAIVTAYNEGLSDLFSRTKVIGRADSLKTTIGGSNISIEGGRIETCTDEPSGSLIVLPANEFFDDACMTDPGTALGAFVQAKFPTGIPAFRKLVAEQLRSRPFERVERELGVVLNSYGVGATVFLPQPLGSAFNLLLAAVTTERPREGPRAALSTLFHIVREAHVAAGDRKLGQICLPVIGAGHGALNRELALLCQLLAWCDVLYGDLGRKSSVRIIVFQADKTKDPEILLKRAKRLLRLAAATCRPAS